jgi:uncharacterized protein
MAQDISDDLNALRECLTSAKNIAVIGLSANPSRSSHDVAQYLQRSGYRIIPVNPALEGPVLGEQPYPDLAAIPPDLPIDIINVFRRSEDAPSVAEQARSRPAPAFWMQLDVASPEAAAISVECGMDVVQNRCIKATHKKLGL